MIKIRIRNDDHEIDLQFPISEYDKIVAISEDYYGTNIYCV